jgi:tetratricopeptide (TPR) repeat protein
LAIKRAIELNPRNSLYRNNIAAVLIEQGKLQEAVTQLKAVHGPATAYYNVGYLLQQKGQRQIAVQYFNLALEADPSMVPAQRWIEYLQRTDGQTRLSGHPVSGGVRVVSPPPHSEIASPEEPGPENTPQATAPMPQRLPPIERPVEQVAERPRLPGISNDRSSAPTAPLPPENNDAIEPLPRVE